MTLTINKKNYEAGELVAYVEKLEKENTELQKEIRCECTRCVYSDSPCIRSDYGVENDEDVCPNYENVFVAYTQCKKENAELKENFKIAKDNEYEYQNLLNKAKEHIRTLISCLIDWVQEGDKDYCHIVEAEQFLKEIKEDDRRRTESLTT